MRKVYDVVAPGFRPAGVDLAVSISDVAKAEYCHPEGSIRSGCRKDLNAKYLLARAPTARSNRSLRLYGYLLALAILAVAALTLAPTARCQGDSEFGVWGGYSLGNPHLIGVTSNRQLGSLGLRYGHLIFDTHLVSLEYTLDIIPVEILRQPTFVACNTNPNNFPTGFCQTGRESVYGGGINPLGLKLNFLREKNLQPFAASTAGFVASVRPIPVDIPGGTQFNFTFDFQAGFQLYNSEHSHAWTLGYKYQHISNAYRHSFNPGVDLNMIFVGYSFYR